MRKLKININKLKGTRQTRFLKKLRNLVQNKYQGQLEYHVKIF